MSDGVVADCDWFNIGGDDPDFVRVDKDAVVVQDRLAIKRRIYSLRTRVPVSGRSVHEQQVSQVAIGSEVGLSERP